MIKVIFTLAPIKSKTGGINQAIRGFVKVNGTRAEFRTGYFVSEKSQWVAYKKTYTVKNDPHVTNEIIRIKSEITSQMAVFNAQRIAPTAKEVILEWQKNYKPTLPKMPQVPKGKSFAQVANKWLSNFYLKVTMGKKTLSTYETWKDYTKKINLFFGERELSSLKYEEHEEISVYFEKTLNLHANTSAKVFSFLKRILKFAVACDYMQKNPFETISFEKILNKAFYLDSQKLHELEKMENVSDNYEASKDVFLFCAYTGLSYLDYAHLTDDNLKPYGGRLYIVIDYRLKSPIISRYGFSQIPVHRRLRELINKYGGSLDSLPLKVHGKDNYFVNKNLKYFWGVLGVNPKMALKNARTTFSNYARRYWKLHKDTIQMIMGHANRETKTLDMHYLDENLETLHAHLENIKGFWD